MRIAIVAIIVSLSLVMVNANMQDNIKKLEKILTRRGKIQISVQIDDDDRTITLEAEPSDTIKTVKVMIQSKEGIPIDQQTLFYNNDELYDSYKLSDYNIKDGSIITLVRED